MPAYIDLSFQKIFIYMESIQRRFFIGTLGGSSLAFLLLNKRFLVLKQKRVSLLYFINSKQIKEYIETQIILFLIFKNLMG